MRRSAAIHAREGADQSDSQRVALSLHEVRDAPGIVAASVRNEQRDGDRRDCCPTTNAAGRFRRGRAVAVRRSEGRRPDRPGHLPGRRIDSAAALGCRKQSGDRQAAELLTLDVGPSTRRASTRSAPAKPEIRGLEVQTCPKISIAVRSLHVTAEWCGYLSSCSFRSPTPRGWRCLRFPAWEAVCR